MNQTHFSQDHVTKKHCVYVTFHPIISMITPIIIIIIIIAATASRSHFSLFILIIFRCRFGFRSMFNTFCVCVRMIYFPYSFFLSWMCLSVFVCVCVRFFVGSMKRLFHWMSNKKIGLTTATVVVVFVAAVNDHGSSMDEQFVQMNDWGSATKCLL